MNTEDAKKAAKKEDVVKYLIAVYDSCHEGDVGYIETKLRHEVQRASPFLDLCGFQNDGIFRVPSRALFNEVEMPYLSVFPLFVCAPWARSNGWKSRTRLGNEEVYS